jgi:Arc/MetJ-type ribon-helix-helix transcriptional regulator
LTVVTTDIPEQMDERLRLLIAVGLYKSKSEAIRDAIRQLADKYNDRITDVHELRASIAKRGVQINASDLVVRMREEEMH